MLDKSTPQEFDVILPTMVPNNRICLSIPADGKLYRALLARRSHLQADENIAARKDGREARRITIQDVIVRHCCEMEGVSAVNSTH